MKFISEITTKFGKGKQTNEQAQDKLKKSWATDLAERSFWIFLTFFAVYFQGDFLFGVVFGQGYFFSFLDVYLENEKYLSLVVFFNLCCVY